MHASIARGRFLTAIGVAVAVSSSCLLTYLIFRATGPQYPGAPSTLGPGPLSVFGQLQLVPPLLVVFASALLPLATLKRPKLWGLWTSPGVAAALYLLLSFGTAFVATVVGVSSGAAGGSPGYELLSAVIYACGVATFFLGAAHLGRAAANGGVRPLEPSTPDS